MVFPRLVLPAQRVIVIAMMSAGLAAMAQERTNTVSFIVAEDGVVRTEEGKAVLEWRPDNEKEAVEVIGEGHVFEVQYSQTGTFGDAVSRYEGPDLSTSVTGLPEGSHYYRVRMRVAEGSWGPWSETLQVEVLYPGRGLVMGLMLLGAVVLVATVAAVWRGHVRHSRTKSGYPSEVAS